MNGKKIMNHPSYHQTMMMTMPTPPTRPVTPIDANTSAHENPTQTTIHDCACDSFPPSYDPQHHQDDQTMRLPWTHTQIHPSPPTNPNGEDANCGSCTTLPPPEAETTMASPHCCQPSPPHPPTTQPEPYHPTHDTLHDASDASCAPSTPSCTGPSASTGSRTKYSPSSTCYAETSQSCESPSDTA